MASNTDNAQTCRTCGALVDSGQTHVHSNWHRDLTKQITADVMEKLDQVAAQAKREAHPRGRNL